MSILDREKWKTWSNLLTSLGVAGCLVVFLWQFGLIGLYSNKRPREPIPQKGWIQPLHWTHGCYGTPAEDEQLVRLHYWFFPFIVAAFAGATIKKLHEKNEPWKRTSTRQ
jgi:hypothetical protein